MTKPTARSRQKPATPQDTYDRFLAKQPRWIVEFLEKRPTEKAWDALQRPGGIDAFVQAIQTHDQLLQRDPEMLRAYRERKKSELREYERWLFSGIPALPKGR